MEYPRKKTAPPRVIYNLKRNTCENLEISMQDVNKNTQKLMSEMTSDRSNFLNLMNLAEQLDAKCENLQKEIEEMAVERECGRVKIKNSLQATENLIGICILSRNNSWVSSDDSFPECDETKDQPESKLFETKLMLDNELERGKNIDAMEIEPLGFLQFTTEADESGAIPGMPDFRDDFEDMDAPYEDHIEEESVFIKLPNGGHYWGCKESLAPVEPMVNGDRVSSTSFSEIQEPDPNNSLLAELSEEYRILIEKYKALIYEKEKECQLQRLIHPYSDNMSGQPGQSLNQNISDVTRNSNILLHCQQCLTCTCRLPRKEPRTKSKKTKNCSQIEKSNELGDGLNCKYTQTESNYEMLTHSHFTSEKISASSLALKPNEEDFRIVPKYKELFQDIFSLLKTRFDV